MPIKPENKHRYPANWREVRARILARAGNRCEGTPQFPDCRVENGLFVNRTTGEITDDPMQAETWDVVDGHRVTRIVLTIAHMNHMPEDCSDDNLRALCQRCHLAWDHEHHQRNAYMTRRAKKAVGDLFEGR